MPSRTRIFLLTCAVALLAALPASAHAAAWVGHQSVPTVNGRTQQPAVAQIGVDDAGNAVLVTKVDKGPPQYAQLASRPVGGDWSAAQELGSIPSGTGGPSLAVDPAGNALIVFVNSDSTAPCTGVANACLHVVSRSPAGVVTTEALVANGGTAMFDPAVALDPRGTGDALIAWRITPTAGNNRMQAIQGTIGGAWPATGSNIGATTTSTISSPRAAIDGQGRPLVMYLQSVTGFNDVMSAATSARNTWIAPVSRANSSITGFSSLFLKTNRAGDIDAAWSGQDASGKLIQTMSWSDATGSFPAPAVTITTALTTHNLVGPRVETAADGEAVAVWMDDFTSTTSVRAVMAAVRSGGTWSSATPIDPNTVDPSGPATAIDAAGNVTAVWHNATTGTQRYAVHPHGGSFGGAQDGLPATLAPIAAADAAGHVHAAWALGSTAVDTAVFDQVAPTLGTVTVAPTDALTGVAVQFDGSATDTWSGPVTLHWDFGDGQSADGASVAHAFDSAGSFAPKLVATDAAGNTATVSSAVQVSPSPVIGKPGLARPIAGKTVNLEPVTGTVLVKVPGAGDFVPLTSPTQVIDGAIIDARKGRVRITIDNGRGGYDTAEFYGGVFRFTQPKVKPGQLWFANLYLYGGSFTGCPRAPRNPKIASASKRRAKKQQTQSVRHLWGTGHGAFRTVGRFSAATVRGTTWLTDDRCNGTLTKVATGKVGVRDFVLNKTVVITKGKSYFAQPKTAKAAKKR